MSIEFGLTNEPVNTQFAPVAALLDYYVQQKVFDPLEMVVPAVKKRDFSRPNQFQQVVASILTGCKYLSGHQYPASPGANDGQKMASPRAMETQLFCHHPDIFVQTSLFMRRYDLRGGAEIEQFRADKSKVSNRSGQSSC